MEMLNTVSVRIRDLEFDSNIKLTKEYIKAKHKKHITIGSHTLTAGDLMTMLPGSWMNDKVCFIEHYYDVSWNRFESKYIIG